jgi:hypothetical protein
MNGSRCEIDDCKGHHLQRDTSAGSAAVSVSQVCSTRLAFSSNHRSCYHDLTESSEARPTRGGQPLGSERQCQMPAAH